MRVLVFLARRIAWTGILMLAICLVTYVVFFVIPQDRGRTGLVRRTGSTADDVRRATGIGGPVYVEYATFVRNVFTKGSLGSSPQSRREIADVLGDAIPVTASVVVGGVALWLLISVPLGVLSALRPRSLLDRAGTVFVLVGLSVHPVSLGLVLAYVLGFRLHATPISGYADLFDPATEKGGPVQWAYHLLLPWFTFAMLFAALYVRMVRATVTEELHADHVVTARAKGASEWQVVRRHVLRNALLPVVTMLGLDMAHAVASVIFAEQVFGLPGLGRALVQSLDTNDLPVTMGVVLFVALAVAVLNLVVDVCYAFLDPRMRRGWRPRRARRLERDAAAAAAPAAVPASGS